jgi:hypothetical protein
MKMQSHRHSHRASLPGATLPLIVSALLLFNGGLIQAQTNYSISRSKIAGGGGTSTNGQYSLSGTLGQYDASNPMTGGGYSLTGGFWAGGVGLVQTPGAPVLTLTRSGANIVLSWAGPATGFVLQQTSALVVNGAWTDVAQTPVDNGNTRSVTVSLAPGNRFFRLRK